MYFDFYSYKDHHKDSIKLMLSPTGWTMTHECYNGQVEPNGMPHLQRCVAENYAITPPALGDAFQELWVAGNGHEIEYDELQKRIDIFSDWVATYNVHKHPSPTYTALTK